MTKPAYHIHGEYACFYPGPFSQWYKSPIQDGELTFTCAEQMLMYRKAKLFNDGDVMHMIMRTNNPREHKHLGRQVKNYKNDVWVKVRQEIAVQNNFLKFTQNEELKKLLLSTGDLTLVEASPYDIIWGIGRGLDFPYLANKNQWRGQNILGYALTEVKRRIREQEKESENL